jgi:hypothetical protein
VSKKASLKMALQDAKGKSYDLLLSLQENKTKQGIQWEWHLPQHFGWGRNDMGIFTKTFTQTDILVCLNANSVDAIIINGIIPRTFGEFPFSQSDYKNKLTGSLEVQISNYYLQTGWYDWSLHYVSP